ncbi:MAG TPA: hypothetical protein VF529_08695 [Solirubrobacteraceae bacterium]
MPSRGSYDAGERIRVTRDAHGALVVHHGATQVATIKQALGGGYRVEADQRSWRLRTNDDGWRAEGEPPAVFIKGRLLQSDRLIVDTTTYKVAPKKIKGLLQFEKKSHGGRPHLEATLKKPPDHDDPHALIALATAAAVLGVDLRPPDAHIPAQQTPGLVHGPG